MNLETVGSPRLVLLEGGLIPSRAGYPTATLASMDRHKALSNYHRMSDTPENVDFRTVRAALTVSEAIARELAANPWL